MSSCPSLCHGDLHSQWVEVSLTFGDLPLELWFFCSTKSWESSALCTNLPFVLLFWNPRNCMWMPEIWLVQCKYLLEDLCYTHTHERSWRKMRPTMNSSKRCYVIWRTVNLKISLNLSHTVDFKLACLKFPSVSCLLHNELFWTLLVLCRQVDSYSRGILMMQEGFL